MAVKSHRRFVILACFAAFCLSICAQTEKAITVRMLDSRTGLLIASSNYLVRINHRQEEHGNWIVKNEDGSGNLSLPADAELVSIHATYDSATLVYANCDADKDRGSAEHAPAQDRWYPVAAILSSGIVAPNNCIGKKVPEKLQVIARPGEFVFFVRLLSARERLQE
ncbi:MAG: hypothetical protein ACLPY1_03085 [Terracidiphilus sp.]